MSLLTVCAFVYLSLFGVVLYGWGCVFRRAFRLPATGHWTVTTVLGLGLLVAIGGVLNLLRLAWPMALAAMLVAGIAFALAELKPKANRVFAGGWKGCIARFRFTPYLTLVGAATILAIVLFTVVTQLPPSSYNFHDDLQKYFAHPVRMLQTGTVFGSPLSALGSETLGGQAFIHAFIIIALPITYINSIDAVFGLFLCLMLAVHCAPRTPFHGSGPLLCVGSVVLINPQYVNVSALYIGAAFIMAICALTCDFAEIDRKKETPNPVALGLLYASLVALKSTFLLFAVVHFGLVAGAVAIGQSNIRRTIGWIASTAASGAGFIAPWLLVHAPHYATAWSPNEIPTPSGPMPIAEPLDFLSTSQLFYGASIAHYTAIALLLTLLAIGHLAIARTAENPLWRKFAMMASATGFAGAALYFIFVVVLGPRLFGYDASIRYFTPIAIGTVPLLIGSILTHLTVHRDIDPAHWKQWSLGAVLVIPLLAFWPSLRDRLEQAWRYGHILAFSTFSTTPAYLAYNRDVLQGAVRERVVAAQSKIPPGEAVIAWVSAPFYFEYSRNPIVDVVPAGLATAWAVVPNSQYYIFQYRGFAYRRLELNFLGSLDRLTTLRHLKFIDDMREMVPKAQMIHNDGEIAVFHLVR